MCRSPSSVPASPEPLDAAEALHAALEEEEPERRAALAREGLRRLAREGDAPELRASLWRQIYRARLEQERLTEALEAARQAAAPGCPMPEAAQTDLARVLMLLDRSEEALEAQRRAARIAPPNRRAFHLWTLASMLQALGRYREAERALRRALPWARAERELLEAHLVWLALERGEPPTPERIRLAADALAASPARGGYGALLQGILRAQLEERERARALLGNFVQRLRTGSTARRLTLRFELEAAERTLARLADA